MQIACQWHISDRLHLWSLQNAWVSHAQNCSITTQKTLKTTCCGPHTHTHTHTQTRDDGAPCWPNPSLIKPSLMWSGHAITLPTLAFTYGHACTQTVWVTIICVTCQQVRMWLTCTPTNALHVRCMFVQLTWCEHRCNQFDHWDIHAWYYYSYYIIYMTYHFIDRLSVTCCIHSFAYICNSVLSVAYIENTLLDHSTRT